MNETAIYLSLHSTQNFRAKAKMKFYIEKHAKTYALILLQEGKESRCHYFLWGSETLKKFVRGNWITHTHRSILYMKESCNTNTRHPKMYLKFFRKVQRLYKRYNLSIIKIFPYSSLKWPLSKQRQRELGIKSMSFHVQLVSLLMQVFSKTQKICSCKRPTEGCLGFF